MIMDEMYWITRLDAIHTVFALAIVLGIIASIAAIFFFSMREVNREYNTETIKDDDFALAERGLKLCKPFLVAMAIAIVGSVFIPDTEQALLIYGVGGTIDYIKSNDKAKQLPDKVIDYLDKLVDKENDKEK